MNFLAVNHHYLSGKYYKCGIYPISHKNFEKNLDLLVSHGWNIADSKRVEKCIISGNDLSDNVLITFDDGLKEQLNSIKIIKKYGGKCLFFVPVVPLKNSIVLDVHKLQFIRSKLSDEELSVILNKEYKFNEYKINTLIVNKQYRYDNILSKKIKYFLNFVIDNDQKTFLLNKIFIKYFGSESEFSKKLYMNLEDWRYLSKNEMIGCHGYSHLAMAGLSKEKLSVEIGEAKEYIEKKIKKPIDWISYPYLSLSNY